MRIGDWAVIIALGTGFGGVFLINALLLPEMGPLAISWARIGLGAAACWLWLWASGAPMRLLRRHWAGATVLGVLHFSIPFAIYPIAQQDLASGLAGVINALTPIAVVIVSQLWPGGERATRGKALGVLAGFAGIVLLAAPSLARGAHSELWAIAVTLLAPLSYALALNYIRRFRGIDMTLLISTSLTAAALVMTPLVLLVGGVPDGLSPGAWLALMIQGPILTGLAFMAIFRMLPRIGATNASTVTFIAPVSAVALGAVVLGERILPAHLAGAGLIFAGLLLIDGRLFGRRLR